MLSSVASLVLLLTFSIHVVGKVYTDEWPTQIDCLKNEWPTQMNGLTKPTHLELRKANASLPQHLVDALLPELVACSHSLLQGLHNSILRGSC